VTTVVPSLLHYDALACNCRFGRLASWCVRATGTALWDWSRHGTVGRHACPSSTSDVDVTRLLPVSFGYQCPPPPPDRAVTYHPNVTAVGPQVCRCGRQLTRVKEAKRATVVMQPAFLSASSSRHTVRPKYYCGTNPSVSVGQIKI
jgi:hypothetical protein